MVRFVLLLCTFLCLSLSLKVVFPEKNGIYSFSRQVFEGLANKGEEITLLIDDVQTLSVIADSDGNWKTPSIKLEEGLHNVAVFSQTSYRESINFQIVQELPQESNWRKREGPPSLTSPLYTSHRLPLLYGKCTSGNLYTVNVYITIGSKTEKVDCPYMTPTWSLQWTQSLADGTYTVSLKASSQTDIITYTLVIGKPTTVPAISSDNKNTGAVSGTCDWYNAKNVLIQTTNGVADKSVVCNSNAWSTNLGSLPDGIYVITAKGQDDESRTSDASPSVKWTIGAIPPAPTTKPTLSVDVGRNDMVPLVPCFSGTAGASATVVITCESTEYGQVTAGGDGKFEKCDGAKMTEGSHTCFANIVDGYSQSGPNSESVSFSAKLDPCRCDLCKESKMKTKYCGDCEV